MSTTPTLSIVAVKPDVNLSTGATFSTEDTSWMLYFDPAAAIRAWIEHVESLPSSKNERHTYRAYSAALVTFLAWGRSRAMGLTPQRTIYKHTAIHAMLDGIRLGATADIIHPLPTPALMTAFYNWLSTTGKGVSASTFNQRYLSAIAIYFKALADQSPETTLEGYMRLAELRESIRRAATKRLKVTNHKSESPIHDNGVRLEPQQISAVLRAQDRSTLRGLQDYALFETAIHSGLRGAELQRITLNSIKFDGSGCTITVRGKGNKTVPVPVATFVYTSIMNYVNAYNATSTPTPITEDQPLWRGLDFRGLPILSPNHHGYGIVRSPKSLANRISRMVYDALGIHFAGHDTRRTCAYNAYIGGMKIVDLSKLLRHASIKTTSRYIGTPPNLGDRTLANYMPSI